jgi:hypothetical protein
MTTPTNPHTSLEEITTTLHERLGNLLELADKHLPVETLSPEECTTLRLARRSHRELARLLTN